jgi:hypothetical protein
LREGYAPSETGSLARSAAQAARAPAAVKAASAKVVTPESKLLRDVLG